MVQPFDPNTLKEHNGLSRLFSFQTGHNPATHTGAYALDRAYPAKLQPDLVERYLHISGAWHQFLAINREEINNAEFSADVSKRSLAATLCAKLLRA